MRNALGLAVAAVLLASGPVGAQMRRAPMPRVQPAPMPSRGFANARVPRSSPPVRVPSANRPTVFLIPQRPVIRPAPTEPATASTTAQTTTPEPSNSAFAPFGGTPIPLNQLLNPTPGLGFDFNHLAAVNSGLAVRSFIDPVTEHELAVTESLPETAPVGVGLFPAFGFTGELPTTQQPEIVVVQEPAPQAITTTPMAAPPAPVAAAPPTPPLPVGKLFLVRRDGTVIQAIAFVQRDGQIVYITGDGMRHSIALNELDIQATEQRNANSGVILHLEN